MGKFNKFLLLFAAALCVCCEKSADGSDVSNGGDAENQVTYTVTFIDGSSEYASISVNSGSAAERPDDPTDTGLTFVDWYEADESLWDFTTPISSDLTLYAKWIYSADYTKLIYDNGDLLDINFNDLSGSYFLMANIDLSRSESWTPIGSNSAPFAGTFDGSGHTISNFTITGSSDYQGLFGNVSGGTISNLKIEGAQVSGGSYVGAICGYATSSSIVNCSVEESSISGSRYVGGVAGSGSVYSSYNTGDVSGSGDYVGGVVGYSTTTSSSSSYPVTSCYNTGDVSGGSYVGGVVGCSSSSSSSDYYYSASSCYNIGDVSGSGDYVGGVVGYGSYVTSCYNTSDVSGSGDYVGGVVGHYFTVSTCYNTGDVSGSSYVGGVAGYRYYTGFQGRFSVSSCYNTGDVSCSDDYVGGVIGYTYDSEIYMLFDYPISSCYNAGNVSSEGDYVGGVIGCVAYPSMSDFEYEYYIERGYNIIASCYFIDRSGDDAEYGVGSDTTNSSYDYMRLSSVSALNEVVEAMNSEAYSSATFTAGNPSTTNLPYLFDENLVY